MDITISVVTLRLSMLNSLNFNNKYAAFLTLRLLFVVLMLLLAGCGSVARQPGIDLSSDGSHEGLQVTQSEHELDVEALFSQTYIDPLTRYLEDNHNNPALTDELNRVRQERDNRCEVIAEVFAKQDITTDTLDRFRRGYLYSCPEAVQAYAEQLQLKVEHSETSDNQSRLNHQASECYLLTNIKNYAEAIKVCDIPAQSGNVRAQMNIAMIHYELKHYELALKWAKLAAESSADAAFLLGKMHEQGQGIEPSAQEALNWYQRAQEMQHIEAGAELLRLSHEIP